MMVKLKAKLDSDARRIVDNAARVAQRCAAWPAWKRGIIEEEPVKKNPLDPAEQFAKVIGARRVCRVCAPFERTRLMGRGDGKHKRCDDRECGCSCQDETRKS